MLANTLNNTGTISLPTGSSVEAVNALTNTGLIDVSGGTLQLDAGISGSSVRGAEFNPPTTLAKWDGTSGITSSFAEGDARRAVALAYITNGATTKVSPTWYGDANGDGVVNFADLTAITAGGSTWQTGDFNYDGVVNSDDYSLFEYGSFFEVGKYLNPAT